MTFRRNLSKENLSDPWIIEFRLQTTIERVTSTCSPIPGNDSKNDSLINPEIDSLPNKHVDAVEDTKLASSKYSGLEEDKHQINTVPSEEQKTKEMKSLIP